MKLTFKHKFIWYYPACDLSRLLFCDIGKLKAIRLNQIKKLEAAGFTVEIIEAIKDFDPNNPDDIDGGAYKEHQYT